MKKNFLKKSIFAIGATCILTMSSAFATTYQYAGSWKVNDGPGWWNNPAVYSGQEAAALLFGGSASDYAISINSDPNAITHTAWYDGWGVPGSVLAENLHIDTGGSGYNSAPGTGSAYSAYVSDHGVSERNFAFRVVAVPEPETYGMLLVGLGLMGAIARRKKSLK